MILLDLNGFKAINDTYGHDAGDAVLIKIARRLQDNSRTEDIVARLGGDEFVVIIHHLNNNNNKSARSSALQTANKVANLVNQPIDFDGTTLQIFASIGIRLLDSEKLDTETVIKEADMAMYHSKQSLDDCVVFFDKQGKGGEPLLTVEQLQSIAVS